jgi:hypothetical protein
MSIEVEGPDGVILEFPDGTSQETMAKAMAKRYPKGGAKPETRQPTMWQSFQAGISQAPEAVMDWVIRHTTSPEYQKTYTQQRQNAMRDIMAPARAANPVSFGAGDLLTTTMMAAPVAAGAGNALMRLGGAAASRAPAIAKGLKAVGAATKTGGIGSGRTAAQTAALTKGQRAASLAARAAGGAVAGGVGAAATGQNPVEGALTGAALPMAAGGARKITGAIVDAFRSDKVRAAALFRKALGDNLDAAKAVFTQLAPDDQRLARKVLIDEGIEPDTFMALGASMERVKPEQTRKVVEAETAAAQRGLEAAAGVPVGGSATDVRAAVRGGRQEVSQAMSPAREAAFQKITDVNRAVSDAERLAVAARSEADRITASKIVPRMRGLETRSREQIDAAFQHPELFTPNSMFDRIGAVADQAGTRADEGIARQIGLRDVARDMEDYVHQVAAADVRPQQAAPLVEALRGMASQPGTRMDDLQRKTILGVAQKIEQAQDANGLLNPYDLYQLRKTGVSDLIEKFQKQITAGTEPRSGNVQRAEQLAGSVRSMIDKTLGPEFQDYLARSAQGYQAVNRQELAGEALKRFKAPTSAGYLGLFTGEEPKTVAKIMKGGPEQENIANVFASDPARWAALSDAAKLLQGRNRMAELATSGSAAAADLMNTETPRKLRAATKIALSTVPAGRIAMEGAEQLTGDFMKPKIRERLAEGFMSGRSADELLNAFPQSMLTDEQISRLAPYQRNLLAQTIRNYFMSPNALAGQ